MKAFGIIAIVGLVESVSNADAQDQCTSYVGQVVTPETIDAAIANLPKVVTKGEYETTLAFETRKAASTDGIKRIIVSITPLDRKYFQYNADSQTLRIISDVFGYYIPDMTMKLIKWDISQKINSGTHNVDVTVSETDKPAGSYIGSNSFGAQVRVSRILRVRKGIFDKDDSAYPSDYAVNYLFHTTDKDRVIGELKLSPSEAQTLKPTLKLALVVTPKEPFLVRGSQNVGETTVANPLDITERFSILMADMQCGLIMSGTNKVLGAYPTK
jgi:hypothetical protein